MKINKENLEKACTKINLDSKVSDNLWVELSKENSNKFNIENLLYYFGAMIVMAAMGWFLTKAWDSINGLGISFLGIAYFIIFLLIGRNLWFKKKLLTPGGLLLTISVWMMPLIVFGVEKYFDLWPGESQTSFQEYHVWMRASWIIMEVATIAVSLLFLRYVKFPFLTFPIAFSLWYLSMDLTPLIFGVKEFSWEEKQLISVIFGFIMLVSTYFIDKKTKEDYAFWGYLFGVLIFWGGLSSMDSNSELNKFIYLLINLFMILVSVIIQRRVFIVFGAMGIFGYLGHLAFKVFEDSLLFPVVLSLLGVAIIYLGIYYNKNKVKIEASLIKIMPNFLLNLNPNNRR